MEVMTQPCFIPILSWKGSMLFLLQKTIADRLSWSICNILMNFWGHLTFSSISTWFHSFHEIYKYHENGWLIRRLKPFKVLNNRIFFRHGQTFTLTSNIASSGLWKEVGPVPLHALFSTDLMKPCSLLWWKLSMLEKYSVIQNFEGLHSSYKWI